MPLKRCSSGSPVACPQRDASAPGMSSKECPWCHHIPKGLSLLPACPPTVTTMTYPQTDTELVYSQRDVPTASMSPKGRPQCQPHMMCPK